MYSCKLLIVAFRHTHAHWRLARLPADSVAPLEIAATLRHYFAFLGESLVAHTACILQVAKDVRRSLLSTGLGTSPLPVSDMEEVKHVVRIRIVGGAPLCIHRHA